MKRKRKKYTTGDKVDSIRLEEGSDILLDFDKIRKVSKSCESVLPVAVQDLDNKNVLLVAYVNEIALRYTMERGIAAFWSTSRNELWVKGATSINTLQIIEIRTNCEQNSLLYIVRPAGEGVCHTKDVNGKPRKSCFYRRIKGGQLEFVDE